MTDDPTREFYSISDASIRMRYVETRRAACWVAESQLPPLQK